MILSRIFYRININKLCLFDEQQDGIHNVLNVLVHFGVRALPCRNIVQGDAIKPVLGVDFPRVQDIMDAVEDEISDDPVHSYKVVNGLRSRVVTTGSSVIIFEVQRKPLSRIFLKQIGLFCLNFLFAIY